jgi:cytochrome c2
MAPSLAGLFDRNIASDGGYERYSPALISMRNKVWSTDSLKDFLSDPSKFSPGTTHVKIDLNVYELDRIVNLLSKIK